MKKKCTSTLLSPSQLVGDTRTWLPPPMGATGLVPPPPSPVLAPAGGVPQLRAHRPGRGGRAARHRHGRGAARQEIRLRGQVSPPGTRGTLRDRVPTYGGWGGPLRALGRFLLLLPPTPMPEGGVPVPGGGHALPPAPPCCAPPRFLVHRYSVLRQHAEASGAEGTEGTDPSSPPRKGGYHDDSDEVSAPPPPPKDPPPIGVSVADAALLPQDLLE